MDNAIKAREYQKARNELAAKLNGSLTARQRANYRASFEQLSDEISRLIRPKPRRRM